MCPMDLHPRHRFLPVEVREAPAPSGACVGVMGARGVGHGVVLRDLEIEGFLDLRGYQ